MSRKITEFSALKIAQLKRKFKKISSIELQCNVKDGWIRFIRNSFGMTLKTLAERSGLSISSVGHMEKREIDGKITLESLKKLSRAMDCHLIYAIIPDEQYDTYIKKQAYKKAARMLNQANIHMELEDQKVTTKKKDRLKRLTDELIQKGDIW